MVEYKLGRVGRLGQLDAVFGSLADATRRDILRRVMKSELSVSEIAAPYDQTLAAISKHVKVLELARLIRKRRRGKQIFLSLSPPAFKQASEYLARYKELWEERFNRLEEVLREIYPVR